MQILGKFPRKSHFAPPTGSVRSPSRPSSPSGPSRSAAGSRPWSRRVEAFLRDDVQGAVSSEYVVLVGTVGLAVAFAVVTIGPRLVQSFERTRNILVSPFP